MTIPTRSTLMDFSSLEDGDLMKLIASHQPQAMEALYERYGQRVYNLTLSVVESPALAEEITRFVFLQTWREARTPHSETNEAYHRLTTLLTSDLQQRGMLGEKAALNTLENGTSTQPPALPLTPPPSLLKRILDEISKPGEGNKKMERIHAIVKGRVQGVGFRAYVIQTADLLRLKGWVRNCWDGSVELVAEGEKEVLERLIAALKIGPRLANVTSVKFDWEEASGEFDSFSARATL